MSCAFAWLLNFCHCKSKREAIEERDRLFKMMKLGLAEGQISQADYDELSRNLANDSKQAIKILPWQTTDGEGWQLYQEHLKRSNDFIQEFNTSVPYYQQKRLIVGPTPQELEQSTNLSLCDRTAAKVIAKLVRAEGIRVENPYRFYDEWFNQKSK